MTLRKLLFFALLTLATGGGAATAAAGSGSQPAGSAVLADYNVVWDTPSANALGSMPAGNGDIGANVWVSPQGELFLLISKTDAVNANGQLLKIGRVKLTFSPALPAQNAKFAQTLDLQTGEIRIRGTAAGNDGRARSLALTVWVDANAPVVSVAGESDTPFSVEARYDGWRRTVRKLAPPETHALYGVGNIPDITNATQPNKPALPATGIKHEVAADTILPRPNALVWFQRNTSSIYKTVLELQALGDYPGIADDPLLHRTFGAIARGKNFVSATATGNANTAAGDAAKEILHTAKPVKKFLLNIAVNTTQKVSAEDWEKQTSDTLAAVEKTPLSKRRAAHREYWKNAWEKHHVFITAGDLSKTPAVAAQKNAANKQKVIAAEQKKIHAMTRGYVLQRYINLCAGRGNLPIKFNGSIFNVDHVMPKLPFDADYRSWGGCYWYQNTRLAYWPMLHSGDFDTMKPFFKMFIDALPLSKFRVKKYYNHDGIHFPEAMYFWGTYNNDNYGWNRFDAKGKRKPDGLTDNTYIRYYWQGVIETLAMMLDYYDFTGSEEFFRETLLPFADGVVTFYREHYTQRTPDGKILFSPAQSLETFHSCTQPLPEIAGLRYVLPRLIALKNNTAGDAKLPPALAQKCFSLLADMPPVPVGKKNAKDVILPGLELRRKSNCENPELYAVFPFRVYGVDKPDLQLARDTYSVRTHKDSSGWQQNAIQAAYLGLANDAAAMVKRALNTKHAGSRFPAFWGPNYDWVPDQDHGNVQMRAIQNMLLQTEGDKLLLLPAWPSEWNCAFKLHAPKNTTIEGEVRDGKLIRLKVTPAVREKDIFSFYAYSLPSSSRAIVE